MSLHSDAEIASTLSRLHAHWGEEGTEKSAADPDAAITSLLRQAISLQETDPDSKTDPQDIKVLGALRNALLVQEADNRGPEEKPEATAASMKTCPTCEGSGKVPY